MTFDTRYQAQLYEAYPAAIVDQIVTEPTRAPLPRQDGKTIPYVYVKSPEPSEFPPQLYVPGYSEGIVNKASFAAELALQGIDVILPGQNRRGILRDAANKRCATTSQAENYLAVLDDAHPEGEIGIIAHSYGALITERMTELRPERFEASHVNFLAPAGSIEDESMRDLFGRWIDMIKSEAVKNRPCEFPDAHGVTGAASGKTLAANLPRALREGFDLLRRRVDYPSLAARVAALSIFSYAEDKMFPPDRSIATIRAAVQANYAAGRDNINWSMPVDFSRRLAGEISSLTADAVHDDEQYNPKRVVGALKAELTRVRDK